jgi:hypothetical protein
MLNSILNIYLLDSTSILPDKFYKNQKYFQIMQLRTIVFTTVRYFFTYSTYPSKISWRLSNMSLSLGCRLIELLSSEDLLDTVAEGKRKGVQIAHQSSTLLPRSHMSVPYMWNFTQTNPLGISEFNGSWKCTMCLKGSHLGW